MSQQSLRGDSADYDRSAAVARRDDEKIKIMQDQRASQASQYDRVGPIEVIIENKSSVAPVRSNRESSRLKWAKIKPAPPEIRNTLIDQFLGPNQPFKDQPIFTQTDIGDSQFGNRKMSKSPGRADIHMMKTTQFAHNLQNRYSGI